MNIVDERTRPDAVFYNRVKDGDIFEIHGVPYLRVSGVFTGKETVSTTGGRLTDFVINLRENRIFTPSWEAETLVISLNHVLYLRKNEDQ